MNLKVHLVFDGDCEEAFSFYRETLGGEIVFIFRKKEEKGVDVPDVDKDKISHMILKTEFFELAGEDKNASQKMTKGNNNKLVLVFQDLDKCREVFDKFSANGWVTVPLEKTFFCDGLGEVTDKYGIPWLIMVTDEGYEA